MMLETTFNLFAGSTTLWFAAAALLVFMFATAVGSVTVFRSELAESDFRRKADLMPAFAELQAAEAALGERRREHDELLKELNSLRGEQAEAQRHQLDAQHWQSLAEQAKRDYDNRQELVDEVERLRADYENAANDLAARNEDLAELIRERSKLGVEIEEAQKRLEALEEQRQNAEDLTEQLEAMGERRDALLKELDDIKDQRDEMRQARAEIDHLERRKAALEDALKDLPVQIESLETRKQQLKQEVDELIDSRDELRGIRDEVDRLTERKIGLGAEIESLEREKIRLEEALGVRTGEPGGIKDVEKALADLARKPSSLFNVDGVKILSDAATYADEREAIDRVEEYLSGLGFVFDTDSINQFHTSLKTSRISPLTVLAGISGTGKSLLPQRYAEAMGIAFLKVAVQPRWDSPQDLLGFYNYLEKGYKATELARALVHMDPNPINYPFEYEILPDRMLLVLLDEMNLARVEYYFSEFLSRLEGRPDPGEDDERALRSSRIEIDIPLAGDQSLSIYPGHNTLFVGTVNEDESTQTLSDKVLDRANTIRFKRPETLVAEADASDEYPTDQFLTFETWQGWHRTPSDLSASVVDQMNDFIKNLNVELEKLGRPFGHRVNQAIFSYAANHPDFDQPIGYRKALADMMRMRILPKLRGIEMDDQAPAAINVIATMIEERLEDPILATRIRERARMEAVFNWLE